MITKIVVNWGWVQVKGHALASIIVLVLEKDKDNDMDQEVGWPLITTNVPQEENDKLRLVNLLKAYHENQKSSMAVYKETLRTRVLLRNS